MDIQPSPSPDASEQNIGRPRFRTRDWIMSQNPASCFRTIAHSFRAVPSGPDTVRLLSLSLALPLVEKVTIIRALLMKENPHRLPLGHALVSAKNEARARMQSGAEPPLQLLYWIKRHQLLTLDVFLFCASTPARRAALLRSCQIGESLGLDCDTELFSGALEYFDSVQLHAACAERLHAYANIQWTHPLPPVFPDELSASERQLQTHAAPLERQLATLDKLQRESARSVNKSSLLFKGEIRNEVGGDARIPTPVAVAPASLVPPAPEPRLGRPESSSDPVLPSPTTARPTRKSAAKSVKADSPPVSTSPSALAHKSGAKPVIKSGSRLVGKVKPTPTKPAVKTPNDRIPPPTEKFLTGSVKQAMAENLTSASMRDLRATLLPAIPRHPNTRFDDAVFMTLLKEAICLTFDEKRQIISLVPTFTQSQIDRLIETLREERREVDQFEASHNETKSDATANDTARDVALATELLGEQHLRALVSEGSDED